MEYAMNMVDTSLIVCLLRYVNLSKKKVSGQLVQEPSQSKLSIHQHIPYLPNQPYVKGGPLAGWIESGEF